MYGPLKKGKGDRRPNLLFRSKNTPCKDSEEGVRWRQNRRGLGPKNRVSLTGKSKTEGGEQKYPKLSPSEALT